MPGVSQVEIDSADKVNFSKALRSMLRHDPDIVMIGEIRDQETAGIAIKAALTGHLVLSTLHTNNATGVVTRLIDMGMERFLVAATLRLSVAQRLVRRLCPHCRRPRPLTSREAIALNRTELEGTEVFDAGGCVYCAGRGYNGRIALFEMLPSDEAMAELIASGASEEALMHASRARECGSLIEDALDKITGGVTTVADVLSSAVVW
jgi:type II secretory ATPase GspE/PulE/Tfp pilus assembly ATPase PilB-like protein